MSAYSVGVKWAKSMPKRKKTDIVQFKLRLREELRKRLEAAATAKDTSLNSEMVHRLEQSFVRDTTRDRLDAINSIQDRLDALINARDSLQGRFDALIGKLSPILDTPPRETDKEQQARLRSDLKRWQKEDARTEQEPELPLHKGEKS
jgi:hypothetical protein